MNHAPSRLISSIRIALLAAAAALLALALPSAASALPSDRAYEMVSPPEKNGQGVGAGLFFGAFRAAGDGHAIGYTAMGGWGDAPANGAAGFYLGARGEEAWASNSLLLPVFPAASLYSTAPKGISRDFSKEVIDTNLDPDTGEEIENGGGWAYLVDPVTKERELLTGESLNDRTYFTSAGDFKGSDDFSVVYFSVSTQLTPEAPATTGRVVYRYADGELEAISKNPAGVLGDGILPTLGRAVSADGSVVIYNGGSSTPRPLYRRDFSGGDDPQTLLVNASENTTETVPEGGAEFVSASRDGSIVYFTSAQKLVDADADTTSDLYRWDGGEPAGARLTLISVDGEIDDGETGGVATSRVGPLVSPDGSRVYFVHDSQLVDGEPTGAGKKLYVWDADDGLRYIATDNALGVFNGAELAMSDNGDYLGLLSKADLTGDNATGLAQAYLYDYAADALACASCAAGSNENTAAAMWKQRVNTSAFEDSDMPNRNVSNNGDVFFETPEGLLPNDTNNKFDVYVWKDGGLDMLSTGRSGDHSHFADADASGENAFFYTRQQLSGWDTDNQLDLYDARVNGGLPEPPTPPAPCTGDDCQGDVSGDPGYEDPGTSTYEGEGNKPSKANRCIKAERRSNRLERRAKQLQRKAHRAHGKKKTRRLNRRAKRVNKKARTASRRATRCNRRAQS